MLLTVKVDPNDWPSTPHITNLKTECLAFSQAPSHWIAQQKQATLPRISIVCQLSQVLTWVRLIAGSTNPKNNIKTGLKNSSILLVNTLVSEHFFGSRRGGPSGWPDPINKPPPINKLISPSMPGPLSRRSSELKRRRSEETGSKMKFKLIRKIPSRSALKIS